MRILWCMLMLCAISVSCAWADDEFVGPMPSWINVKNAPYNAKGDGKTDDTTAIQNALNAVAVGTNSHYLYFPAGTYMIHQTLTMTGVPSYGRVNYNLIGAYPATTTLKWAGANGVTMMHWMGITAGKCSRITFDGNNVAGTLLDHDWNGVTGSYAGEGEFSDLVFKNATNGLLGGQSGYAVAETIITRCQFTNLTGNASGTFNGNALDWWYWYCTFTNCGNGVYNAAGRLSLNSCMFNHSTTADINSKGSMPASVMNCYSSGGSGQFFAGGNPCGGTFQRNTVLDTVNPVSISLGNYNQYGPATFIDNTIRSAPGAVGPVVNCFNVDSIGNTYTVTTSYNTHTGRLNAVDDVSVDRATINPTPPTLPGTLPSYNRVIYNVPLNGTQTDIQNQITAAANSGNTRPVVFIPHGTYNISTPLIIPAGKDVQLMGEGIHDGTELLWTGVAGQPVIRLAAPSKAIFREIMIFGDLNKPGDCIELTSEDSVGSRVFADHLYGLTSEGFKQSGQAFVKYDQCDNTIFEIRNLVGGPLSVAGGPNARADSPGAGILRIFSSCGGGLSVLENRGSLLVNDTYTEDGKFQMSTGGTYTLQGSGYKGNNLGVGHPGTNIIDGQNATATFIGNGTVDEIFTLQGDGASSNVLFTQDCGTWNKYTGVYYTNTSAHGQMTLLNSTQSTQSPPLELANQGPLDAAAIRKMFTQTRGNAPYSLPLSALGGGVTDVRLYRVTLANGQFGLHVINKKKR